MFSSLKRNLIYSNNCLDILGIKVKLKNGQYIMNIINIYNVLHGSINEKEAITKIMNSASLIKKQTIIARDFNLHYWN